MRSLLGVRQVQSVEVRVQLSHSVRMLSTRSQIRYGSEPLDSDAASTLPS